MMFSLSTFDLNQVTGSNRAALQNPGKYSLPGHNAIPNLPADGTSHMTLLAYLGNLQFGFRSYPQTRAYRQQSYVQAFNRQVLGKVSKADLQPHFSHLINTAQGEKAYLAMPGTRMGITFETMIRY
jgi:hypothetical protein